MKSIASVKSIALERSTASLFSFVIERMNDTQMNDVMLGVSSFGKFRSYEEIAIFLWHKLNNHMVPHIININQIINRLAQIGYLNEALKLYDVVVKRKMATIVTFNTVISAISKSHNPSVECALTVFYKAREFNFFSASLYSSMIHVIAKSESPNLELALALFNEAKQLNCLDGFVYNTMLSVIAKTEAPNVRLALSIFYEAKMSNHADQVTYNTLLLIIARSEVPDVGAATGFFHEARQLGLADVITYNTLLSVIHKSAAPNVKLALDLYHETIALGIKDEITMQYVNSILTKVNTVANNAYVASTQYPALRQNGLFPGEKQTRVNQNTAEFTTDYRPLI